ncbi:TniQ family protein [Streptomyces sp. 24-1644]|uniref:TniQ family protein n=1 Tax=Streptomyces sp. 24-1644 TaxID=3457315 RepID=UPI003FA7D9AA
MSEFEPLARSLTALPGESLAGFLLRLSHRLDLAPGRLAWRTGLTSGDRRRTSALPAQHLFMLEAAQLSQFALTTRLSESDADRLTLRSYLRVYPPVAEALVRGGHQARPRGVFPPWLLHASTRCCPLCLRGDGSLIQERHGGAWKRQWNLPVVFGCLEHNLFLQDTCQVCRQPVQSGFPSMPRRLLPMPSVLGLHPAQCRNTEPGHSNRYACGARLDSPSSGWTRVELPPESASLQIEMLGLLEGDRDPAKAFTTFTEIRVMSAIVRASWPQSADLLTSRTLKDALDAHETNQQQPLRGGWNRGHWSAAPAPSAAMAALLGLAHHYVRLPQDAFQDALSDLLSKITEPGHSSWAPTWDLLRQCSPDFRREVEDALQRRFPPRLTSPAQLTNPLLEVGTGGYRAEQIPQELPEEWFKILVEGSTPNPLPATRALRRIGALQLVQAVNGVSRIEAAQFLGIPAAWLDARANRLPAFGRHLKEADYDWPAALGALAHHIAQDPYPIDYHARRDHLANWTLSSEAWKSFKARSKYPPRWRGPSVPDDRLQVCVSALIWAKATNSEWILAPALQQRYQSRHREANDEKAEQYILQNLNHPHRSTKYAGLAHTVQIHAADLLQQIQPTAKHSA